MTTRQSEGAPLFNASPDAVVVNLDRETVVYHRGRSQLYVLNPSAAAIFRLCNGERGESEIAQEVERNFRGAEVGNVNRDVHQTVTELIDLGLIQRDSNRNSKGDDQ